jgi:hypothetical protein
MSYEPLTVGELRRLLEGYDDTDKIHLPGQLSFYRIKRCAENEFFIEVNEPHAYISEKFKKKNPHIKTAFISTDNVEWGEDGIASKPINVELT